MQVKVYKELSNFTPKAVGPFTLRQFGALLVCVPICFVLFKSLNAVVGRDIACLAAVIPGTLAFVIGWTKPYGMYVEQFVGVYVRTRLLAPYRRKYVVKNTIVDCVNDANVAWEKEHAPAPEKKKRGRDGRKKKKQSVPDGAIL